MKSFVFENKDFFIVTYQDMYCDINLVLYIHIYLVLYRNLMDNQIVTIDRGAFSDLKELDRLWVFYFYIKIIFT